MGRTIGKSLATPDETRVFPHGRSEIVDLGGLKVAKLVLEPGWRWSEHVRPIAGTASCQATHHGYVLSGRLGVRMDDGAEALYEPGDAYVIEPGHDGWTVGDDTVVVLEFSSAGDYAKEPAG